MSTTEKILGAFVAGIAVLGAVLTVLGLAEAAVIAALLVVLYGLFLLAQLLREARRQKRSTELLREAARLSRDAIAEARLEGVHARNDIVGNARRIRADLKDQARRSYRRDGKLDAAMAGVGSRISAEAETLGAAVAARITKEARGTRAVSRDVADDVKGRLIQAEGAIVADMETRTRQVRRQAVTERTSILTEAAKSEARLKEALSSAAAGVQAYQQVTTQKLVAQQDGLRRVVDLMRGAMTDLEDSVTGVNTTLEHVDHSLGERADRDQLDQVAMTLASQLGEVEKLSSQIKPLQDALSSIAASDATTAVKSALSSVEQEIDLLNDNARVLSEHVLALEQRVTGSVARPELRPAPSMGLVGRRIDALRDRDGNHTGVENIDIDVTIAAHRDALERLRAILEEVRLSETLSADERQRMLVSLYGQLGMQDVKQEYVLDVNTYGVGVSFRAQMVRLMHLKDRLASWGYEISPRENDKMRDKAFAEALGVPAPRLLFRNVPTSDVTLEPDSIIKPMVGESSRGVFYVRPDLQLISLKTRNVYRTFREAAQEYSRWASENGDLRWIGERAVLSEDGKPAHDLKVFMFYGRVGLFVEVVRFKEDSPGIRAATYDETGQRVAYRESDDPDLNMGLPEGVVELATKISLASPVPFLRIDFLVGADGPVLGEITPHPGGIYAADANDAVDRRLGQMFLDADARLTIDFLNGKEFQTYLDTYGVGEKSTQ